MPSRQPRHSTDADLEALQTVCDRLQGFDDRISVDWVDGYLTALLSGPRTKLPSEWLPAMLGDAFDRTFADPPDAEQALHGLLARWNVIADQLHPDRLLDEPDALRLSPLMTDFGPEMQQSLREAGASDEELADLPRTGEEWAHGFMQATLDFPDDWPEPDAATADGQLRDALMMKVVALTLDEEPDLAEHLAEEYPGETLNRDELIDEACMAVQDLRVFWLDHAPKPATRRVDKVPGRNEPCPCGSGRKYKKCHGAQ